VTVLGQTSSELFAEAVGAYSGTWTFRWIPNGANDWPSAYTIKSISQRGYNAIVKDGTGTAKVKVTGGSDLVTVSLPSTITDSSSFPAPSTSVDTTVSGRTITTKSVTHSTLRTISGARWQRSGTYTIVDRAYTAQYFLDNFADPEEVELIFSVSAVDLTARVDYTGSSSASFGSAVIFASDVFSGQ
jgi:hypothetical protein